MIDVATLMAAAALVAVILAWLMPAQWALDAVAAWSLAVLAWLSWPTALWLGAATVLTPLVLAAGERTTRRGPVAGLWAATLIAGFTAAQLFVPAMWIGASFFTLRLLHVTGDWWMSRTTAPSLRAHLRYQFFLPVLFIGPIHRLQTFERQVERRRRDAADLGAGAERALVGLFLATVIGEYLVTVVKSLGIGAIRPLGDFTVDWASSAFDWVALYFVFAGLTGVALGLSLMIGLRLEENFDRPWKASSLIDFWTRWHMSLTSWCRDYVFTPVMAISRSAVAGLLAAMLVVGLWHEFSLYYILWSVWQATGVMLNRLAARALPLHLVPAPVLRALAPLFILGWLSLARPVLARILGIPA